LMSGLILSLTFIYAYELIFVSMRVPDRENQYEMRSIPVWWIMIGEATRQSMLCVALPAWLVVKSMYVPYYGELVYFPLLGGALCFGYGCLLGWGYETKRFRIVIAVLTALWLLFLCIGWILHMW
jgi:hypothetical protein